MTDISLGILPTLLGYQLRRAQLAVFENFAEVVGASELTPGQFGVLVVIDANPGLSQTRLGGALGVDRSTVVAVIDRLEQRGLVLRQAGKDRRHLLRGLTFGQHHLGESSAQRTVVIHLGEIHILEGKMPQAGNGLVRRELAPAHLLEEFADRVRIQESIQQSAFS